MNPPTTHCPTLVNAVEMNRQHPYTFNLPTLAETSRIASGSLVRVSIPVSPTAVPGLNIRVTGERFWVEVCGINKYYFTGIVKSRLLGSQAIKHGDLIRFALENIFEVSP